MQMADCISLRSLNSRRLHLALSGVLLAGACLAQNSSKVTAVRFWSIGDVTRVAIEVSAEFKYKSDRVPDPDRVFFDIQGARPSLGDKGSQKGTRTIAVGDKLIKQIRVAETQPGVTRVVLDLEQNVDYTASQLSNPERLMIEIRPKGAVRDSPPARGSVAGGEIVAEVEPVTNATPPPVPPAPVVAMKVTAPVITASPLSVSKPEPAKAPSIKSTGAKPAVATGIDEPKIARRNSTGDRSLTRVLGLKLGRVVLDPGHGGHDVGTHGPSGLYEKDVVLDISKRLGELLEDRLGSEVVYTRDDDTFIPLEERTKIANDHKADLFLSIHANSSPVKTVSGVETYYLNFTTSKAALDVAARENATAQSSIFDLKEVVEKITLKDKIDESKEFASKVESALYTISKSNNKASKDRGIKKAPFVVLIGAQMPSVLAEIGFLTNASDEALMRKPDHRQKIAEALYKGIASYAETLSHSQLAKGE